MADEERTTDELDFATLDIDDAKNLIDESLPDEAEANELFMDGDHWQDGDGWIGPVPPVEDSDFDTTLSLIKEGFTSRNVIREIVQRRVRGVIGREPRFGVVPRAIVPVGTELSDAQKKLKLEIESALTEWWDSRKVHKTLERAVTRACWATKGPLRVYIPRVRATEGEVPKQNDLASALRFIHVEAPDPAFATVATDEDTRDEAGILLTEVDGKTRVEICFLGDADVEGDRPTIFRTIEETEEGKTASVTEDVPMSLGNRITMAIIESDLLITTQQQQMQRALNLCLTMIPHNIITGGFLERIILNGLPPGHWEVDDRGKRTKFIREPFVTGAGSTAWISGIELPNKQTGEINVTSPSVQWRQPIDPAFASNAKRSIYQDMLEEADQAHVLMAGDATSSGVSRVEARAGFEMSLTQLEGPTNSVGRWLIEIVLAVAEALMQTPGAILEEWRGQFECRVSSARLTETERQQNVTEMNDGLLSEETVMERNGVADVEAERARIAASPRSLLDALTARATIVQSLSNAGADIAAAARVAGIEDPDSLTPTDVPPAPAVPPTGGGGPAGGE